VTAVHLVERVLPHVPYRQWTLSFAHRVRWALLKDVGEAARLLDIGRATLHDKLRKYGLAREEEAE
jgi:hypothetical protein